MNHKSFVLWYGIEHPQLEHIDILALYIHVHIHQCIVNHNLCFLGRSMFYFCWVSVENWETFKIYSLSLLVIPQLMFLLATLLILTAVVIILCKRLPTSSKIRVQILKQNFLYVFVLTFEAMCVGGIWLGEYFTVQKHMQEGSRPCFCCHKSLLLGIAFAALHSIRGVVDCVSWFYMFSIGPRDCSYLWKRISACCKKRTWQPPPELSIPLIIPNSTTVDRGLRRDIIYCINCGILDVIDTMIAKEEEDARLGQVYDPVSAAVLMKRVEEEEDNDAEQRFVKNSLELNTRKIKFTPKSTYGIFSFVSMEPSVFRLLWKYHKLNLQSFKQSFHIHDLKDVDSSGMQEQFSEGKSGSFFYFTHDRRYVIKTVNAEEKKFLCKIAPSYYEFIKDNPDSLIVRLYGLYQVQLAWEQKYISVIVMENIFYSAQCKKIHERYDLKGSTVKRETGKKNSQGSAVLKDRDLQNKVYVGPENKAALLEQLKRDTEYLASHHIMDYSLLIGVHDHNRQEQNIRRLTGTLVTDDDFQVVDTVKRDSLDASLSLLTDSQHSREESFMVIDSDNLSQFKQDYGGLRSYTPHHPIYAKEAEASANQFPNRYDGKSFDDLPVATYYIGLVDILQEYNVRKQMEHFWKVSICRADAEGISVVDPKKYRQRFLDFVDTEVFD